MVPVDVWKYEGIGSLGSPYLVRRFQALCGIKFVDKDGQYGYDSNHMQDVEHPYSLNSRKYCYNDLDIAQNSFHEIREVQKQNDHSLSHGDEDKIEENQDYVIKNKLLYYLFLFGAALGNEMFYCVLWSNLFWHWDEEVSRGGCLVWCITLFLGQVVKEVVAWPRPSSPPAAHLERRYVLEFGMPSTHAVVGVSVPFSLLYLSYMKLHVNVYHGLALCTVWCSLTAASRTYLGMHSVLDVLAGLVLGAVLLVPSLGVVRVLDGLLVEHEYGALVIAALMVGSCFLYPRLKSWNTSRADSYMVCAVTTGVFWGCRINYLYHVTDDVRDHVMSHSLIKSILGLSVLAGTRCLCKTLVTRFLCWLHGLNRSDPESLQCKRFEMPYKFLVYVPICVMVVGVCPQMFSALGID